MLEQVLLGTGLNQILAGVAFTACTMITYKPGSNDPHAALALSLSSISAYSQVVAPFVMQKPNVRGIRLRVGALGILQILVVVNEFLALRAPYWREPASLGESLVWILCDFVNFGWIAGDVILILTVTLPLVLSVRLTKRTETRREEWAWDWF